MRHAEERLAAKTLVGRVCDDNVDFQIDQLGGELASRSYLPPSSQRVSMTRFLPSMCPSAASLRRRIAQTQIPYSIDLCRSAAHAQPTVSRASRRRAECDELPSLHA